MPPYPRQTQAYPGRESDMRPQPDFGEHSYRGSGRLLGKKAIVTGGDSGIGRAVAVGFAREGADVLISYLNEDGDAQETTRVIRDSGRTCIAIPGDITEERQCQRVVERAVAEFGQLDVLVNNAAYQMTRDGIEGISSAEWHHTLRTNLYAMFWLCKAALPLMREGGAIINTSSIQAYQPSSELLAYATTKGAIVTFTKALSEEAIKKGIRVNAVAQDLFGRPSFRAPCPRKRSRTSAKILLLVVRDSRLSWRRSTSFWRRRSPATSRVKWSAQPAVDHSADCQEHSTTGPHQ
jgi:NAD(P)-dependent dehydrogenase (short-subunit alcohol dehydrogenase family)